MVKSVQKLFAAINAKRVIALHRFIYALGIRQVGEATAKKLAEYYQTFDALRFGMSDRSQAFETLINLSDIGPLVARDIIDFFQEAHNQEVLDLLQKAGVEVQPYQAKNAGQETALSGKTLIFTGTLEKMTRQEAKAFAEKAGARVVSALSTKTDYLIAGAKAGSKLAQAEKLGVQVLSEEAFLSLIGI